MNQNNNKSPNKKDYPKIKKPPSITFWIVIVLLIIILYQIFSGNFVKEKDVTYSQFMKMAESGLIKEVYFNEKEVKFKDKNELLYSTYLPFRDPSIVKELQKNDINIISRKPSQFLSLVLSWLPFIVFLGFWIFMMRSMGGGTSKAFSFGKSKARLFASGEAKVSFKDVAGVDEAKEELEEIVEFLKNPQKFQSLGGKIPRGVLLFGRPGTGKTLLAKAVAGEANVPFFSISGSDFVEMFVGVGASRVRNLFEEAKKASPCIAFIDEIDAVGRHRGTGLGGGHDEREQTLNQLLVEMDGFEPNESVIIIAASNRPDVLDPALLRPGRFDRQVVVDLPDIKGREAILKVHAKSLPMAKDVSFSIIARSTPGFSGADLANLLNESALFAARKDKKIIEMSDIEEAKDKVVLGKEKKNKVISEDEKKITAYHEIGHVICSIFLDKTDPVHKVTIIPRGFSGGATHFIASEKSYYSKDYLEQMLTHLLGGRAAEEIKFKDITTGAGNDITRATDIVKKMVCSWGMSTKIGPIALGKEESEVFLGKDISQKQTMSLETAKTVDEEITHYISKAYIRAKKIILDNNNIFEILAEKLLEKETLDVDTIFSLILENIQEKDKELIEAQYEKSKKIRIDTH